MTRIVTAGIAISNSLLSVTPLPVGSPIPASELRPLLSEALATVGSRYRHDTFHYSASSAGLTRWRKFIMLIDSFLMTVGVPSDHNCPYVTTVSSLVSCSGTHR